MVGKHALRKWRKACLERILSGFRYEFLSVHRGTILFLPTDDLREVVAFEEDGTFAVDFDFRFKQWRFFVRLEVSSQTTSVCLDYSHTLVGFSDPIFYEVLTFLFREKGLLE